MYMFLATEFTSVSEKHPDELNELHFYYIQITTEGHIIVWSPLKTVIPDLAFLME